MGKEEEGPVSESINKCFWSPLCVGLGWPLGEKMDRSAWHQVFDWDTCTGPCLPSSEGLPPGSVPAHLAAPWTGSSRGPQNTHTQEPSASTAIPRGKHCPREVLRGRIDLINIYGTLCPAPVEYMFFSRAHSLVTKIHQMFEDKTRLTKMVLN